MLHNLDSWKSIFSPSSTYVMQQPSQLDTFTTLKQFMVHFLNEFRGSSSSAIVTDSHEMTLGLSITHFQYNTQEKSGNF
jgi:hypothetical protein